MKGWMMARSGRFFSAAILVDDKASRCFVNSSLAHECRRRRLSHLRRFDRGLTSHAEGGSGRFCPVPTAR